MKSPKKKINNLDEYNKIIKTAVLSPKQFFSPLKKSPIEKIKLKKHLEKTSFYRKNTRNPKVKIIGVGTYGCVTIPSFPCSSNESLKINDELISKVLDKESALLEMKEAKFLSKIDILVKGEENTKTARYKYGVYALSMCKFPVGKPYHVEAFKNATGIVCDIGTVDGDLNYIVHMERANGDCSVFEKLNKTFLLQLDHLTKPVEKLLLSKLKNVLNGLINMHSYKVYHLDVKVQNMLYFLTDNNMTIKLADFGATSHLNGKNFKDSHPFHVQWFNFPPASYLVGYYFLNKKTFPTNTMFTKAEKGYQKIYNNLIIKERKYKEDMFEDVDLFISQGKTFEDLACAVDMFGFATAVKFFEKYTKNKETKKLIHDFCVRAAAMSMTDSETLHEYNNILHSL